MLYYKIGQDILSSKEMKQLAYKSDSNCCVTQGASSNSFNFRKEKTLFFLMFHGMLKPR